MLFRSNLERIASIYGGIAVFSVLPGSPTARAGVRSGDILVRVNGQPVSDLVGYVRARRLCSERVRLEVVRGGRRRTLWAECERPEDHDRDVLGTEFSLGGDQAVGPFGFSASWPIAQA